MTLDDLVKTLERSSQRIAEVNSAGRRWKIYRSRLDARAMCVDLMGTSEVWIKRHHGEDQWKVMAWRATEAGAARTEKGERACVAGPFPTADAAAACLLMMVAAGIER